MSSVGIFNDFVLCTFPNLAQAESGAAVRRGIGEVELQQVNDDARIDGGEAQ